ncbi:hypothetical protein RLIN73S_06225 [Rhodanobacter lindaniclasticus]
MAAISTSGVSANASVWRSEKSSARRYTPSMPAWKRSSTWLRAAGAAAARVRWPPRKRPHSAGVSVSETAADTTIAATRVIANSCMNMPATPPANSSGMNTATSEAVIETMVKPISRAPVSVACLRSMPSSMCRMMFSITTMASSTTKPIAITSASRVRLLSV